MKQGDPYIDTSLETYGLHCLLPALFAPKPNKRCITTSTNFLSFHLVLYVPAFQTKRARFIRITLSEVALH
jgi:hypothetical protein